MIICRGKSPGGAANRAINTGLVESEKATIIAIPPEREAEFEKFANLLLSERDIKRAFPNEKFVEQRT